MNESIRDILAREAAEAESLADDQESSGVRSSGGQRARVQTADASQVYSVRIPVDRLEQLRRLAADLGVRPTALLRQFVLDRLDQEFAPVDVVTFPERAPNELRLGPSRSAPYGDVIPLAERRA
jgi:hypothetical protein